MLLKREYIGKEIRVEYPNGDIATGVLTENNNSLYPFWFKGFSYTNKGEMYKNENSPHDIVSVTLVGSEDRVKRSSDIDLSNFASQVIKVLHRNGDSEEGVVNYDSSLDYPIEISGYTYTTSGSYYMGIEDDRDIVEILSVMPQVEKDAVSSQEDSAPVKMQEINLSLYVGKTVVVEFRDSRTPQVVKIKSLLPGGKYEYRVGCYVYTTGGRYYSHQDSAMDIVRVVEVDINIPPPTPPVNRLMELGHQQWGKQAKEFVLNYNKDNVWKWLQQANMSFEELTSVEKRPHRELAEEILNLLETEKSGHD